MRAVNAAIQSRLTGDATLVALLADNKSVYHLQARDNAPFDFVVYNKQAGTRPNDTDHEISNLVYQISAYSDESAKVALTIDARIEVLFHKLPLTVTGYTNLSLKRIDDIETVENEPNTVKVYKAGGLYRIITEQS